ncbi:MAG: pyridoxamine 5'-phosphate oxidase family protein [Proteobacteria bacterium]|nr:pyridoxamine 5'-phosphate oxidase family protein [Pseudomonadota bacterium]
MATLPSIIIGFLDGTDLRIRAGQAFRLSTVDAEGWPHGAQVSVGEVLATDPATLHLCLWRGSGSTANLRRDGRATLSLALDGAMWEIRLHAVAVTPPAGAPELAYFRATVESVQEHRAKYAEVTAGVSYRLHSPDEVLARWEAQLDALRRLT